jgi:hypothetical protein
MYNISMGTIIVIVFALLFLLWRRQVTVQFTKGWCAMVRGVELYFAAKGKKLPFDIDELYENSLSFWLVFWTPWYIFARDKTFRDMAKNQEAVDFVIETYEKEKVFDWLKKQPAYNKE